MAALFKSGHHLASASLKVTCKTAFLGLIHLHFLGFNMLHITWKSTPGQIHPV